MACDLLPSSSRVIRDYRDGSPLAEICGVDRCSIFTWDETTGAVVPVVSHVVGDRADVGREAAIVDLGPL